MRRKLAYSLTGTMASTLLIAAVLLGGCATTNPWDSQELATLSAAEADMVAESLVEILETEYAPGQNTFAISKHKPGSFGLVFEKKLRETGYAVAVSGEKAPEHSKKTVYIIDKLEQPNTFRVGLQIAPTFRIDRIYKKNAAGTLVDASSITVRGGSKNMEAVFSSPPKMPEPKQTFPADALRSAQLEDRIINKLHLGRAWQVQVMAGENIEALDEHKRGLKQRMGFKSHIVSLDRLYALRIGPFDSAEAARAAMEKVRLDRYKDAYLVAPEEIKPTVIQK